MKSEKINEWIKTSHENAVEKGFYEKCTSCSGKGKAPGFPDGNIKCFDCNNGLYCDIGEALFKIIEEIGEAGKAWRKQRFAFFDNVEMLKKDLDENKIDSVWKLYFEESIKDTFEDEIADTFIRLFDLCGYLKIGLKKVDNNDLGIEKSNSVYYQLSESIKYLSRGFLNMDIIEKCLNSFFTEMILFCKKQKIDIETHINLKMAYNKTRPYKQEIKNDRKNI